MFEFKLKLNEIIIAVLNLLNLTFYGIIPEPRGVYPIAIVYRVIELVVHKIESLDWPPQELEVYELCIPLTWCLALRVYCRLIELSLESISSHFEGITRTSKLIKAPQRPFSQLSFVRYVVVVCFLGWTASWDVRVEKRKRGGECRGLGALGVALSWHFCRIFE